MLPRHDSQFQFCSTFKTCLKRALCSEADDDAIGWWCRKRWLVLHKQSCSRSEECSANLLSLTSVHILFQWKLYSLHVDERYHVLRVIRIWSGGNMATEHGITLEIRRLNEFNKGLCQLSTLLVIYLQLPFFWIPSIIFHSNFKFWRLFSVMKWLDHGMPTFLIINYNNYFRWYRGKGNRFFSKSWLGFDPDRKSHTLLRPKAVWNWERKVHPSCCGHEAGDKEGSCRECTYFLSQRISKVRVTKD